MYLLSLTCQVSASPVLSSFCPFRVCVPLLYEFNETFTGVINYFLLLPQKSSLLPFSSPSLSHLMYKHSHHFCNQLYSLSIHSLPLCLQTKGSGSLSDVSIMVTCIHLRLSMTQTDLTFTLIVQFFLVLL